MPIFSGGGAGFTKPSQWTIDSHGGLTIAPDSNATVPLTLKTAAGSTALGTTLIQGLTADDATNRFVIDAGGELDMNGVDGNVPTNKFRAVGQVDGFDVGSDGSGHPVVGFFGQGPIVQPSATPDPRSSLASLGLIASGGPTASEASTLSLGTAYQHSTAKAVLLVVYLSITVNTSGVIKLGVGPTNTPTQQTIVTGVTTVGFCPIAIYLPASYFALLSITGTITDSIAGQIAIPV